MKTLIPTFFLLLTVTLSTVAQAVTVEAEGRVVIHDQDIDAARREALRSASQQALLQAGAWVSSSQSVSQGVLSDDNLQVRSVGSLTNVRVIDEQVQGNLFVMKIRADVETEDSCQQSTAGASYVKSAAITAFPVQHPTQASLGDLHDASRGISKLISDSLSRRGSLRALNASHLAVNPAPDTAASYQQDNGSISDTLPVFRDMDVQFIVSGVIRDLNMFDPTRNTEGNYFGYLYDSLDYRGRQHMRNFGIEVFVHDGFTGALLFSRNYRTGGIWALPDHTSTGFGTAAFLNTDYGQQVNRLIGQISQDLDRKLKCEPFRARIVRTRRNSITFNAGSVAGIRPGDKLMVYRKSTFFDQQNQPHVRLEDTRNTLTVNEVHPLFSEGKIGSDTERGNIQQDDVLIAW